MQCLREEDRGVEQFWDMGPQLPCKSWLGSNECQHANHQAAYTGISGTRQLLFAKWKTQNKQSSTALLSMSGRSSVDLRPLRIFA